MQFDDTTVEQVLSHAGTKMTSVKPAGTLKRARSHLSGRSRTAATQIEASVRELLERHASQIGNVHLLKGLECDHAGVLCADESNARERYVA